ncbi:MAG: ribonuclease HII [Atopobiaceae bacterium]|nr:ribonuclease HII [Atopobiaceae bacterium]MDO4405145.1 ribonuclease HII [Atopobiaceae bacterium]
MPRKAPRAASAKEVAALLHDAPFEETEALIARYGEDPRAQVQKAVSQARRRHEAQKAERERVLGMYQLQDKLAEGGVALGVDEVGRGSIAGPLTVCAVALPQEPIIWGLNDSKQLTPVRREALAARIAEHAIAIGIAHIEPASIDATGMAIAIRMGMAQAIEAAGIEPDAVLIDGNPVHVHPREVTLVKGDARVACIAAASIVAKVTRDAMMVAYAEDYPEYHFDSCKGYGSKEHIEAIRTYGLSPLHRVSFCGNFLETPRLF